MTDPISRTELYERVSWQFYEEYPDAPRPLRASSKKELRTRWIEIRDSQLDEEVNRVYWARYPEAPLELDATSPEWEKWRVAWIAIRDEVMANAPEPEDVEPQDDGQLDLTHLKASIREHLVDLVNTGELQPDLVDTMLPSIDQLADEVGEQAMRADTTDGVWESREVEEQGRGAQRVKFRVRGWWADGDFDGGLEMLYSSEDYEG